MCADSVNTRGLSWGAELSGKAAAAPRTWQCAVVEVRYCMVNREEQNTIGLIDLDWLDMQGIKWR
jgi:hypothetical protein